MNRLVINVIWLIASVLYSSSIFSQQKSIDEFKVFSFKSDSLLNRIGINKSTFYSSSHNQIIQFSIGSDSCQFALTDTTISYGSFTIQPNYSAKLYRNDSLKCIWFYELHTEDSIIEYNPIYKLNCTIDVQNKTANYFFYVGENLITEIITNYTSFKPISVQEFNKDGTLRYSELYDSNGFIKMIKIPNHRKSKCVFIKKYARNWNPGVN